MKELGKQQINADIVLLDSGDWNAGIRSLEENVNIKITFEYGGWDEDLVKDLKENLKDFFKEQFDIEAVLTKEEYNDQIKRENEMFLQFDNEME